jgi:hypothetical protein
VGQIKDPSAHHGSFFAAHNKKHMSQAFVKESDDQWLHEVSPTVNALVVYLTRENNNIRVYELKTQADPSGREVHEMSNGLKYAIGKDGKWEIVW